MAMHELKCWPRGFHALANGEKTCEWRWNDRGFVKGDLLVLREWDPVRNGYTEKECRMVVVDVETEPRFGIPEGYAMLSLRPAGTVTLTVPMDKPFLLAAFKSVDSAAFNTLEGNGEGGDRLHPGSADALGGWLRDRSQFIYNMGHLQKTQEARESQVLMQRLMAGPAGKA